MVFWAFTARGLGLIPGWELRSHKLCDVTKRKKEMQFLEIAVYLKRCVLVQITQCGRFATQLDESTRVSTCLSLRYLLVSVSRIKYTKLLLVMYEAVILSQGQIVLSGTLGNVQRHFWSSQLGVWW